MVDWNSPARVARRKAVALIEIMRWIWVMSLVAAVAGLVISRFDVAAASGGTCFVCLIGAGIGRRSARRLCEAEGMRWIEDDCRCE